MSLLQHHVLAQSLTALTTFWLGLLVFLTGRRQRLNQVFGLYSLAIAWWAGFEPFMVSATTHESANLFAFFEWVGVIFIAPTFLHTVLLLSNPESKAAQKLLIGSYGVSLAFLILHLSGLMIGPARPVGYARFFTPVTSIGALVPLAFLVIVNVGLWKLRRTYYTAEGQRRMQLKYLYWASLLGYCGGSPDWFFNFGFCFPPINPFGMYAVPCYSLAMTYAALHHKLFNVNLVIRKSLVYSLLVTGLTVGYFGLVYGVERAFQSTFGYHSVWLSLTAFALMALLFQPLKVGIQRLVDLLLFRAPHEELVRRLERLEQEVRQSDKLKAISTLAAGLAHEIKNPLTSIKTFTAYLSDRSHDQAFQQKFQRIVTQEVDKIEHVVRRLLEFAKPAPPTLEMTHIPVLLDETLELLSNECLARHVDVQRSYQTDSMVRADPRQMRQVFLNLVLNSLDAMNGAGGTLSVSTRQEGSQLTIAIQDSGCGISNEHLNHVFDPFFTTKPIGTGLGLAVVQGIINEHHGTIRIASTPGRGTTVYIELPLES